MLFVINILVNLGKSLIHPINVIRIIVTNLRFAAVLPKADWLVLPNENAIFLYCVTSSQHSKKSSKKTKFLRFEKLTTNTENGHVTKIQNFDRQVYQLHYYIVTKLIINLQNLYPLKLK